MAAPAPGWVLNAFQLSPAAAGTVTMLLLVLFYSLC
jgi:hypothetical protein